MVLVSGDCANKIWRLHGRPLRTAAPARPPTIWNRWKGSRRPAGKPPTAPRVDGHCSGSSRSTSFPSSFTSLSVSGLKVRSPAIAKAVTISGLATNAWVFGFPSLRFAKFLLKLVMIEFLRFGSSVCLAHCPMQGPQAFASTTPPIESKVCRMPSRSFWAGSRSAWSSTWRWEY